MSRDRITQIRIRGLRVIEDVTLDLDGLTVLIGDNGSGKSTILDAFEILRLAATPGFIFVQDVLVRIFGGAENLVRMGSKEFSLKVVVQGGGSQLDYSFAIAMIGTTAEIVKETLDLHVNPDKEEPLHVLLRTKNRTQVFDQTVKKLRSWWAGDLDSQTLAISSFGMVAQPAFKRLLDALSRIEFQVPFDTRPLWQQKELGQRAGFGPRWHSELSATRAVARYGWDLPNYFHELRNRGGEVWERVLDRSRLALGHDLRDFVLSPAGRGSIEMEAKFSGLEKNLPIHVMSEGQLSYLLMIAIVELDDARSVLLFDEPETHLHPSLLVNALYLLEKAAEDCPVLIATHSDRLLDALEDPAKSVYLCELDEQRSMRLLRPDRAKLDSWLENYRGLGSLRTEGYDVSVFDPDRTSRVRK